MHQNTLLETNDLFLQYHAIFGTGLDTLLDNHLNNPNFQYVSSNFADVSFSQFCTDLKEFFPEAAKRAQHPEYTSFTYGCFYQIMLDVEWDDTKIMEFAHAWLKSRKVSEYPYYVWKFRQGKKGHYIGVFIVPREYYHGEKHLFTITYGTDRYTSTKTGRLCKKDDLYAKLTYSADMIRKQYTAKFSARNKKVLIELRFKHDNKEAFSRFFYGVRCKLLEVFKEFTTIEEAITLPQIRQTEAFENDERILKKENNDGTVSWTTFEVKRSRSCQILYWVKLKMFNDYSKKAARKLQTMYDICTNLGIFNDKDSVEVIAFKKLYQKISHAFKENRSYKLTRPNGKKTKSIYLNYKSPMWLAKDNAISFLHYVDEEIAKFYNKYIKQYCLPDFVCSC